MKKNNNLVIGAVFPIFHRMVKSTVVEMKLSNARHVRIGIQAQVSSDGGSRKLASFHGFSFPAICSFSHPNTYALTGGLSSAAWSAPQMHADRWCQDTVEHTHTRTLTHIALKLVNDCWLRHRSHPSRSLNFISPCFF